MDARERILNAIKKEGLTKAQYCRKYNITHSTLMHWLSGLSRPPKYTLTMIEMLAERGEN